MNASNHPERVHNLLLIAWAFLCAFGVLLFCTRSSFLYPLNNWDDANSYFTMGKAMMNGKVIYRDLYDQKGPIVYFLYGIAYLMSHRTFAGVFVLEIIAGGAYLLGAHRIIRHFGCAEWFALASLPLLAASVYITKSFYWGGAAEEFCLPLITWGLYFGLRLMEEETFSKKILLLNGIFAGALLLVKYTMLGFYIGWMAMLFIRRLTRREGTRFVLDCGWFLLGMLLPVLPWLFYFGINGALDDWYRCYIYNNIFFYTDVTDIGLAEKFYEMAKNLYWMIRVDLSCFAWIIAGVIGVWLMRHRKPLERLFPLFTIAVLYLGIFIGGNHLPYYAIPLMAFCPVGVAVCGTLLQVLMEKSKKSLVSHAFAGTLCVLMLIAGMCIAAFFSYNRSFRLQKREDIFLYAFRDIVLEEENPTLLNAGTLDVGLYTLTGIIPDCEYFQGNGIALPELWEEQRRYTRERIPQYVVTGNYVFENIWDGYDLVQEAVYETHEGSPTTYYLFKRKD